MKAFAFWNQISPRERNMLALLGLAGFLFINALLINQFVKQRTALVREIDAVQNQIKLAEFQIAERPKWEAKAQWLDAQKKPLASADQANARLLARVKSLGQAQQVIPESPSLAGSHDFDRYKTVSLTFNTASPWPNLVKFMYYLQEPKEAVAFEKMILSTDPKDSGKVRGNFTISQYYAP